MFVYALCVLPFTAALGGEAALSARPGISQQQADSLVRKLQTIGHRLRNGPPLRSETVLVTEGELNSYINLSLAPRIPPGVRDLEVRLAPGERVSARGLVDVERVRAGATAVSPWSPLALLVGSVPVEVRGRLVNKDGFGNLDVDDVRVASFPVPLDLLEEFVASATRNAQTPHGFDIRAPFRLPYSIRRVRMEAGRAFLDF